MLSAPKTERREKKRNKQIEGRREIKQTAKQTDLYTNNHVNRKLLLPYRLAFLLQLTFHIAKERRRQTQKSPQNITHFPVRAHFNYHLVLLQSERDMCVG